MNLSKIAVLDTSTAREIKWDKTGNDAESVRASDRLLQLLDEGYTVYIATTRTRDRLYPETYDKCLFDLIPEDRFFTPNPEMDCYGANSEGLINLWERVLTNFCIDIPEQEEGLAQWERMNWMDLRLVAKSKGITIF